MSLSIDLSSYKKIVQVVDTEWIWFVTTALGPSEVRESGIFQHTMRQTGGTDFELFAGHLLDGAVYFELAAGTCTVDVMWSEVNLHATWQVLKTFTATTGVTLLIQGERLPGLRYMKIRLTNNQAAIAVVTWANFVVRSF